MAPKISFEKSFKCILHDARLTRTSLEAQVARLDQIELDLVTLARICSMMSGSLPSVAGMTGGVTVHSMEILERPDGYFLVSINNGAGKLILPPTPGAVFEWLASTAVNRTEDESDAGWKSRIEIKTFLEELSGGVCRRGYVNQVLHLLRARLRLAGYSADVIESNRRKGARVLACGRAPETLA